ncbi:hypothetical protein Y032_0585g316 [Ancylostoma ceylanicum]|nr:hypothetical protein Y032_0585g316 [Ancylostoma ceylanicum]
MSVGVFDRVAGKIMKIEPLPGLRGPFVVETSANKKYLLNYFLCSSLLSTFSTGSTTLACQEEYFNLLSYLL